MIKDQISTRESRPGTNVHTAEGPVNIYLKGGEVPKGNNITARWETVGDTLTIEVSAVQTDNYPQADVVYAVKQYFDSESPQSRAEINQKDLRYAIGYGAMLLLRIIDPATEALYIKGIRELITPTQQ